MTKGTDIMRFFLLLTVLTAGLMTETAKAGADYTAAGPGTFSCEKWTADMRGYSQPARVVTQDAKTPLNLDIAWVFGFLSGIGFKHENGDDPLNGTDAGAIFYWIDIYCRDHPIEDISSAAIAFYHSHPR
nr:hypothetical protein [uncultured Rhodopila sp.]